MPQESNEKAKAILQRKKDSKECARCSHTKSSHDFGVMGRCRLPNCKCWGYDSALNYDGEIDHEDTDDIICPYCGERHNPWDGYAEGLRCEGDETEIDCAECGGTFTASIAAIRWSFKTKPSLTDEERAAEKQRKKLKYEEDLKRQNQYHAKCLREGRKTFGMGCMCCGTSAGDERTKNWVDQERLRDHYKKHGYISNRGDHGDPIVVNWVCHECNSPNVGHILSVQEWQKDKVYRAADYIGVSFKYGTKDYCTPEDPCFRDDCEACSTFPSGSGG